WVRPARLTQAGRLAALHEYEAALGRPLDIVNTYRRFDEVLLTESDRAVLRKHATLMLSWASGDTRSITLGHHDDLIRRRARELRSAGAPVLLRFRWEMDRPNLEAAMWSAPDYVAAWRHVRRLFAAEGVRNAAWVWCPTAEGFAAGRAPAYYPGDDAVDWVCVDAYAGAALRPLGDLLAPFLTWAAARPKPILIGEYGVAVDWGSAVRAAWLHDAARVFRANPQIKAVSYFESNPDGERRGFRLADDPPAFAALMEFAHDDYFNPR
ncbi:MAG TPA: glycosyl hydrolase, partial [Micromonosporaceae bacterium]|nr:glycosyl hydrolase [Micromonosporaceae bacterium]